MLRLFYCYLEEDNFGIWQVQKIKSDKTCLVYTKSEKSIHNDICILFPVTSRLDTIFMSVIRKPHRFFDSILFSHPLYFEIEIKVSDIADGQVGFEPWQQMGSVFIYKFPLCNRNGTCRIIILREFGSS